MTEQVGQGTGRPQEVHAQAPVRVQHLQVLQPGRHGEIGLGAITPAQFPDPLEQGGIPAEIGGLLLFQLGDQGAAPDRPARLAAPRPPFRSRDSSSSLGSQTGPCSQSWRGA